MDYKNQRKFQHILYIYTRYRTIIEKGNVYKLLKTREPQGSYNKQTTSTEIYIKTVQRTKAKNQKKDIKELQKIRK